MLTIFSTIIPIFALILFGNLLRRLDRFPADFWRGLELLCYYVLYPALLFIAIVRADFSDLTFDAILIAMAIGSIVIAAFSLAAWPLLRDRLGIGPPAFSSVFQTTVRWNGFIAYAVAEKLYPAEGVAVVALVMAIVIIPINIESVAVVAWFTDKSPNIGRVLRQIAINPLIIAAGSALVVRSLPFELPVPAMEFLDYLARAALGIGLVAIGAGLRPSDVLRPNLMVFYTSLKKLVLFPVLIVGTAILIGIDGPQLSYLALCAAVPTAMNGYVLARQLGGDAELYAAIVTCQTAVSFLSIPAVLAVTAQFSGG